MNQRTAQPQLLFHPTGQLPGRTVTKRRQAGAVQQLGNTRFAFSFVMTKETSEKIDVLINR
ncbi:Uncharacterised protein [Salmonella enterica subsp. enterica serovar Bovismorbificans]|uniref:Uncharacterized protein n=1 Tax=Salmonella enterica subsp. enterica serovar Bovismorbificans TaxID=58097 RepID=A0A655BW74_SALET|nr:Uncharacterised protein [Salmonella enterica subsp. enterica serovar Bovismorbificans]